MIKRGANGIVGEVAGHPRLRTIPGLVAPETWANRQFRRPCYPVTVVGTTGAGDATIAGFLMGFVKGFDLEGCLEAACAVGACCVEAADATSGIRPWEETNQRIVSGWHR